MRLGLLLLSVAWAHPSYVSLAEAEHRAGKLEVSLQLTLHDLQRVLHPKPVTEAAAADYLRKSFVVKVGSKTAAVEWVGWAPGAQQAWLYFALPVARLEGATLSYTLFLDEPLQVNTLNLKQGRARATLIFTPSTSTQPLAGVVRSR